MHIRAEHAIQLRATGQGVCGICRPQLQYDFGRPESPPLHPSSAKRLHRRRAYAVRGDETRAEIILSLKGGLSGHRLHRGSIFAREGEASVSVCKAGSVPRLCRCTPAAALLCRAHAAWCHSMIASRRSIGGAILYRPAKKEPFMNERLREYFRGKLNGATTFSNRPRRRCSISRTRASRCAPWPKSACSPYLNRDVVSGASFINRPILRIARCAIRVGNQDFVPLS
jgi:hypothetical protein